MVIIQNAKRAASSFFKSYPCSSLQCIMCWYLLITDLYLASVIDTVTPGGGGGGTLKLSVYIGEADFFGVKILNFRIFLGFQKN